MAGLHDRLQGGFFLSSMMGVTDGAFCARTLQGDHGTAMVQTGAYLAEPTASAEDIGPHASSFLPADPGACLDFLTADCRLIRDAADVAICMNLATPRLEWGLEAAQCFARAGGDLVELNVHGGYGRYLEQGKLRAMVQPEHRAELFRWVEALVGLEIPLIVKFSGQSERQDLLAALAGMAALAHGSRRPFGVHVNVRDERTKRPDLDLVGVIRRAYPGFLLVSGYVRSAADARALFEAGTDMVGIAAPLMQDAGYIQRIAKAFHS